MRRFVSLVGAAALLQACSGDRQPDGANLGARFFLIEPSVAPECGAARAVTAVGQMPDFDDLDADSAWLFQLSAQALEDLAPGAVPIGAYVVREDVARWGSGLMAVPRPEKTWHWAGDHFDEVSTDETLDRLASYRLLASADCGEVVEALCEAERITPCDTFTHYDVRVANTARGIGVAVAVDDRTVLVSAADATRRDEPSEFFTVSELATTRVANSSTLTPYGGAFRGDDGVVWMYGPKGRFATWTSADGFDLLERPPYESGFVQTWLDGAKGGADLELFALTDGGAVERYDGVSWEIVYPGFEFLEHEGGIAWLGPRHAIAIGSLRRAVVRYRDGEITEEDLAALGLSAPLSALANVPGIGALVGSTAGEIYFDDGAGGGWRRFDEGPRDGLEVNGLLAYRDGFVFGRELDGLDGGWAVQYVPGFGLCSAQRVSEADVRRLVALGDGSFVVVGEEVGFNSWVSIVRGAPAHPVCASSGGTTTP